MKLLNYLRFKRPTVKIKLSKEQCEGLARFFDTIAASAMIGAIVAVSGRGDLKVWEVWLLFVACLTMLAGSLFLRRSK